MSCSIPGKGLTLQSILQFCFWPGKRVNGAGSNRKESSTVFRLTTNDGFPVADLIESSNFVGLALQGDLSDSIVGRRRRRRGVVNVLEALVVCSRAGSATTSKGIIRAPDGAPLDLAMRRGRKLEDSVRSIQV